MKKLIKRFVFDNPALVLIVQLIQFNRIGGVKKGELKERGFTENQIGEFRLQSVHDMFVLPTDKKTIAVDLGSGEEPSNRFGAQECYGVDLFENHSKNILKARLGFESLPFKDDSLDYVTAYDLLEHIPRFADLPQHNNCPLIFLMNEISRVLKEGGIFLSSTPIYPYFAAFQDPTHNNIMTADTLRQYFSNQKFDVAERYGVKTNFEILYQKMMWHHLVAVLKK